RGEEGGAIGPDAGRHWSVGRPSRRARRSRGLVPQGRLAPPGRPNGPRRRRRERRESRHRAGLGRVARRAFLLRGGRASRLTGRSSEGGVRSPRPAGGGGSPAWLAAPPSRRILIPGRDNLLIV